MPSPRATLRSRRGWTDEHKAALIGHDWFNVFSEGMGPFTDHPGCLPYRIREDHAQRIHERRRQAWDDLRDELLPQWIAERPYTRPPAWWDFDAPERRRCISGLHPHDHPEQIAHVEETDRKHPGFVARHYRLVFGCPNLIGGPGFDLEPRPEYESERDYLIRLDLLTDRERELLATESRPAAAAPAAFPN